MGGTDVGGPVERLTHDAPDLAPEILRRRLVVEGTCPRPIDADAVVHYLNGLSEVCQMNVLLPPVTHRSDRFGWAGWVHWEASGAQGPYRVAPNLMVVVPTSRHVSLHYGYTTADRLGYALTLLGIVALIALVRAGPLNMPPGDDKGEQLTLFDQELDFWGNGETGGNGEVLVPQPGAG